MGLVTEYPAGFIVFCLLLGVAYAFILYFRDLRKGLTPLTHRIMLVLRFLSVSLIAFLLLGPLIRQSRRHVEKPIVIIGVDNSASMIQTADSDYYRNEFPGSVKSLEEALQKKCEVKLYSFGDKLATGFNAGYKGLKTDISAFFNEVNSRFSNRNVAALVLATDGIYNDGTDPFYAARRIPFPIYTVALGDSLLKKDILIRKVIVNSTAYKGDKFPVEALVEMNKCPGVTAKLTLMQGSRNIDSREIRATSDRSVQKVMFNLDAAKSGLVKYSLHLGELEGERNLQNNTVSFVVEVLDTRQRIALVYDAPHPDVAAIQQGLEGSMHFEIDQLRLNNLPETFDKYDLIILNQLPSVTSVEGLEALFSSKASLLFIIGSQTDINSLNRLNAGLSINTSQNSFAESQPVVSGDFPLFTLDRKDMAAFGEFPPLQCPFGTYQFSPLSDVLCYQKIGNVTTKIPMIMFTKTADKKVGFITGENIWRWRISAYVQQSSHESFDLVIDKIAQYLSVREDKSFFRIHLDNRISENDPVEIDAEVFNASYELINDPDVNITITDSENKTYPFIFSRTARAYYLNAGLFPIGEYTYRATVRVGSEVYQKTGKFFVERVNIESSDLVANHNLLFRIATAHDGEMTGKQNMGALADKILQRDDTKPVSVHSRKLSDLIGNPWLFAAILLLLSAEWIIRKREGI